MDRDLDRILGRPGPTKAERITPKVKGHVPEEKLTRYRHLRGIAHHLETAADMMGAEYSTEANNVYGIAGDFYIAANELRVDIDDA